MIQLTDREIVQATDQVVHTAPELKYEQTEGKKRYRLYDATGLMPKDSGEETLRVLAAPGIHVGVAEGISNHTHAHFAFARGRNLNRLHLRKAAHVSEVRFVTRYLVALFDFNDKGSVP